MNQTADQTVQTSFSLGRRKVGIALAIVAAAVLFGWFFVNQFGDDSSGGRAKPVASSVGELKALAGSVGHAVYWAGAKPSTTYELTRTSQGDTYIRYLPPGVSIGDTRPNFLTVGTYPKNKAFRAVQKAAARKGEVAHRIADGGLAVASPSRPQSVYFAYPGSNLLIEVYHPSAQRALRAVVAGQVAPLQ